MAVLLVSAAIIAYGHEHPVDGGGYALVVGFIMGPILLLASAPWSSIFFSDTEDFPVVVEIALLGVGLLTNALLVGFAIGVVSGLRLRMLRP